jgi:hypothetical protein
MLSSAYAWLALTLVILGFIVWAYYRTRKSATTEGQLEQETRNRLEAERKAKEHAAVADVRGRDLGPTPGLKLRDVDGKRGN